MVKWYIVGNSSENKNGLKSFSHVFGFWGISFHFFQLSESMCSVVLCGSPGSGKSKCVEVFAQVHKQLGYQVTQQKVRRGLVCLKFGYFDRKRGWKVWLFWIKLLCLSGILPIMLKTDSPLPLSLLQSSVLTSSVFIADRLPCLRHVFSLLYLKELLRLWVT